jgi:malonyl CoA-acyl carrier protein transacylase
MPNRLAKLKMGREHRPMEDALEKLVHCARDVAEKAEMARKKPTESDPLLLAMMKYRQAAIGYLAHPTVGDLIKAQALKYDGETRAAVERIAELVDSLNER